jgi:lipopolysaccharide biosynthesis glycosyltransferase
MAENIKIAFCIDEPYAQHLGAAVASIYLHNSINKPEIYIISSGFKNETINRLKKIEAIFGGKLTFKVIPAEKFVHLKQVLHISHAAYYRLMLAEILVDEKKVIYLDADLVVEADLLELWNLPLQGNFVAGSAEDGKKQIARLEIEGDIYINSGVLVIDLDLWRKEKIFNCCMDWLKQNPEEAIPDQDALNIVLGGKKIAIDLKWNLNPVPLKTIEVLNKYPDRILHFGGPIKPWHKCFEFTMQEIYKKYLDLTDWGKEFKAIEPVNAAQSCLVAHQYFDKGRHVDACRYYETAINFILAQTPIDSKLLLDTLNGGRVHSNSNEHLKACEHYRSCLEYWGFPSLYLIDIYQMPKIFESMQFLLSP